MSGLFTTNRALGQAEGDATAGAPVNASGSATTVGSADGSVTGGTGEMIAARGQTMGSTYMVKVFNPPADFPNDWQLRLDREFREITDQMSTYLASSEISRFNDSSSTDWQPVSPPFAKVVARALEFSRQTQGAFDITVLPLVKAWSFGPGKKRNVPPSDDEIRSVQSQIGYQHLEVRLEPPALKKSIPALSIDLNSIAPGYATDRVVEILHELGAKHLFVEVGGEVRVTGDKNGTPWTVGIQQPDAAGEVVAIAYPLRDRALATSGDYRSYFEYEGRRYSHTIDPRTGRPVTHGLASVTVLAPDCMSADAMATVLSVLGAREGLPFAEQAGWDALFITREGIDSYATSAAGAFRSLLDDSNNQEPAVDANAYMTLAFVTACAFGLVIAAMAIGVMFGRRSISGSCGGLANKRDPDGNISCALCSNPDNACKELRERMASQRAD